jgi:hypothetical protein
MSSSILKFSGLRPVNSESADRFRHRLFRNLTTFGAVTLGEAVGENAQHQNNEKDGGFHLKALPNNG